MSEWGDAALSELAEIRVSNVDKKSSPLEQDVRLCNYMDVYGNDYITADLPFMDASATSAEIDRFGLLKGDVLLTKDSETPDDIGIPAVVVDEISNLVCGYHLALIRPNGNQVDSLFLAKQLAAWPAKKRFSRLANGSTRYGLSFSGIAATRLPVPTLSEQHGIAEILATVDKAIERTEALIAKYQQIKAGMMHDLFTRGVTAGGRLRPPRSEAPQLYKESPVGSIPEAWRIERFQTLVESLVDGPFGSNLKTEHYVAEPGVRVVRLQNIDPGAYNDSDRAFISRSHAEYLVRNQVKSGDILVAGLGEDNNVVGRSCCYPDDLPPAVNKADCFRLRCNESLAYGRFVMYFLNTDGARKQVRRFEQGVTRRRINTTNLKMVSIGLPLRTEQKQIVALLDAAADQVTCQIEARSNMQELKRGLMHDLLTGRVRVEIEELAAT